MVALAITGHRPGSKIPDPDWVKDALKETFVLFNADLVIQGMCHGVDLWAARVAYDLDIPYVCVRPWAGHSAPQGWKLTYTSAIKHAQDVVVIEDSLEFPGKWVYQKRNKWMVDHSEAVVSVFDGEPSGGTWNAVEYAHKIGRDVFNCNPKKKVCDFLVQSEAV